MLVHQISTGTTIQPTQSQWNKNPRKVFRSTNVQKIYLLVAGPRVDHVGAALVQSILLLDEGHHPGRREVLGLVRVHAEVLLLGLGEGLHVRAGSEIGSSGAAAIAGDCETGEAGARALGLVPPLQLVALVHVRIELKENIEPCHSVLR